MAARGLHYAGGLLHRTQVFLNGLIELASRHTLDCEVVLVEWNPPPGAPRFREALTWRDALARAPVTLRFIEVPEEVHRRLPNADRMDFHHMVARNVGIRRARGEYLLGTSSDVLFNSDLIRFLASGPLAADAFYRIDRRDLGEDLPPDRPVDEQIAFCERQDVTVHTYYGSVRERGRSSRLALPSAWLRHRALLREYLRWSRGDPGYRGSSRSFGADRLIIPADGLHRNAAGEFFLMHRNRWHELRGYTQLPTFGHADSILCWTAASAGLRQVILGPACRLYHQRHDRELQGQLPATDWQPWYQRYLECQRRGQTLIGNDEMWGFPDQTFPEWTFGASVDPARAS